MFYSRISACSAVTALMLFSQASLAEVGNSSIARVSSNSIGLNTIGFSPDLETFGPFQADAVREGFIKSPPVPPSLVMLPKQKPSKHHLRSKFSGVFGTKAISFSSIATRDSWTRVKQDDLEKLGALCTDNAKCSDIVKRFEALETQAEAMSFYEKLTLINRLVNTNIDYVEDEQVYGQLDYWASAREIVQNGYGDCEDFSILKFALLKKMGIPAKSMSLVVLKDKSRGLYHAVLAVSTNKGHLILDNMSNAVYQDKEIQHYEPLYSFSENRSWLHGKPIDPGATPVPSFGNIASVIPGKAFEG